MNEEEKLGSEIATRSIQIDSKQATRVILVLTGVPLLVNYVETMVIPGVPKIQRAFSTTSTVASWITSAYLIVGSAASPLFGKFGDDLDHRLLRRSSAFIWKDEKTGVLIGPTLFDTKEDYDSARPDMDKALEGVDFRTLDSSMEIYRGSQVTWTA